MKILGIGRSKKFSPNSVDRDRAILEAVASRLKRLNHSVELINEELLFSEDGHEFDGIFSMARGEESLRKLLRIEKECGIPVINSPQSILSCTRDHIVQLLHQHGIPYPDFQKITLNEPRTMSFETYPLWFKRIDSCAQEADDVTFVNSVEDVERAIHFYRVKGIHEILVEKHIPGDLVKFYGVAGTSFLYYYYPIAQSDFSKFGLERHNGDFVGYKFKEAELKEIADGAARCCNLSVYGGDAIISHEGHLTLIDFNDWPSFSPCRKDASRAIASLIIETIKSAGNKK